MLRKGEFFCSIPLSKIRLKGTGSQCWLVQKLLRERVNCSSFYLLMYGESSVKISTQSDSY